MPERSESGKRVHVAPSKEVYDAIVIGSGITGGWAAKELTEKGLETLVLERGDYVEHGKDYITEHMPAWEFEFRGRGDRQLYEEEYYIQKQCYAFGEATEHFFVNDKENPYTTPEDKPFSWIRGYHLGGRSLMWGRQCYRWSDLDFEANAKDGYGVDWPIRYTDIAPWYDYVERHVGISGNKEGLPQLPDGQFLPPMEMTCAERFVEESIENAYPERDVTIGRVAVLTQNHKGRAACHYCGPCHRGCSTGSYFSSLSSTLPAAQQTGNLTIQCDAIVHSLIFDPETKDAWGLPVLNIHCSFGENEEAIRRDAAEQAGEMLEAAGVKNVSTYVNEHAAPGLCIHEMGTARMGRDPRASVLNKWNQAHDVPNLFVTDGACMASSSCVNPSITYMALTARAADYAVKEMKRGNL